MKRNSLIVTLAMLIVAAQLCCSATPQSDTLVAKAHQGAAIVEQAAEDAALLGIPGAGVVALIAAALGSALGVIKERRRGTTPLTSAITQIVRSVEAAFPARTESQKSVMASIQDQRTRALVSEIKES